MVNDDFERRIRSLQYDAENAAPRMPISAPSNPSTHTFWYDEANGKINLISPNGDIVATFTKDP
jgi:hypothetical protein